MPKRKPRKYKQKSIVSGKTIEDIINMPETKFNKLKEKQMKLVVGRLVSAVNKRLRRFKKRGITTPATRALEKSGGKLSVKGKNLDELRKEFKRAREFLEKETSTQAGYKKVQQKIVHTLEDRGHNINIEQLDDMFEVWNDLVELDPSIELNRNKYELWEDIANMDNSVDVTDRVLQAKDKYDQLYKEQQRKDYRKSVPGSLTI